MVNLLRPHPHLRSVHHPGQDSRTTPNPQGSQTNAIPQSKFSSCPWRDPSFSTSRRISKQCANKPAKWLIPRTELAKVDPRYAYAAAPAGYATYRPEYVGMHAMPPPPVYDPTRPPVYEGPDGASKVDPSQRRDEPTNRPADQQADEYAPPPGPPPAAVTANHTGSSNNPFRL